MIPDGLFQLGGVLAAHATVDFKKLNRPSRIASKFKANPRRLTVRMIHQISEVGMWDGRAQNQMNIQMSIGLIRPHTAFRMKAHYDVGELALRADEVSRIRLAPVHISQHLVGYIPALGGVPLDLPQPSHVLGRVKKNLDVVELPHRRRVKPE